MISHRIAVSCATLLLCLAFQSSALLSGFSVTTMRTYCSNQWPRLFSHTYGHIVKFTIENGAVVQTDTLYKEFPSTWPTINLQGDKIAFVRTDGGTVNKHLSVMNADGSNLRDLNTYTGFAQGGCCTGEPHRSWMDWPAGDWIYYNRKGPDIYDTDTVYRINVSDPSQEERVCTYNTSAFALSLDATKATIVGGSCAVPGEPDAWYCNAPHLFPPTSAPRGDWVYDVSYGCGSYLSPSGNYHEHFRDQGHTIIGVNALDWASQTASATVDVHQSSFGQWSGLPQDSVGTDKMWYPRWAVNSDKWICALTSNARGLYMQFLVNWVDQEAVATPHGPDVSRFVCPTDGDQLERNCEAGDLWVAGGPCGSYEDVNGNWIPVGTCSDVAVRRVRPGSNSVAKSRNVGVYTMQGRLLGSWDRYEALAKTSSLLPVGSYILQSESVQERGPVRMHICH